MPPEVAGALSAAQAAGTAHAIASVQTTDGCIPWEDGGHADTWNHVEAAMALDVGGLHDAARRAYRWLCRCQRADGSWAALYRDARADAGFTDANFCAYAATGLWHHFLATGDAEFLNSAWPTLEAAVECVLSLQQPGGEVWWARDAAGQPWPGALLTSSSSICKSLQCAVAAAASLGRPRPAWTESRRALIAAICGRPEAFEPKARWAMDWYYPILCGAVRGAEAGARLAGRWEEFVVDGLGIRCVGDRQWVTVAESCELVLTLDALGRRAEARRVFGWLAPLRAPGGHYWTGITFPDGELWPEERPTWTSAAVLLAADALCGGSLTSGLFKHPDGVYGSHLLDLPRGQRITDGMRQRLAELRHAAHEGADGEAASA